ncbi:hypothetical protein [Oerskovia enterophila]|uniref:Uncharacterized protein n=1 Tax=Oerskovia enterophila TaxID=43678 RepID=A0ABX2Y8E8_9CELL|nr:hypothetical protein [Oerskovia enterophila]OCI32794.1 hypothetical protein OERS_03860 [Oerskovia enterophila]
MKFTKLTGVALVAALAFTGVQSASAAPEASQGLSADDRAQLTTFLTDGGVTAETTATLLKKLEDGQMWDSLAGGTVVSTDSSESATAYDTVTTYADGSISVTSLEKGVPAATGAITPFAVSGCTTKNTGTLRTSRNCTASERRGVVNMSFKVGYDQRFSASDLAYVTGASLLAPTNASVTTIGGTYSIRNFGRTKTTASAGSPATARLTVDFQCVGGWCANTTWMQVNVPINTYTLAYTTHN